MSVAQLQFSVVGDLKFVVYGVFSSVLAEGIDNGEQA